MEDGPPEVPLKLIRHTSNEHEATRHDVQELSKPMCNQNAMLKEILSRARGHGRKGFIIRKEWLDLILRKKRRKTRELRSKATHYRGPVELIESGAKKIVGIAWLKDDEYVGRIELKKDFSKHQVPANRIQKFLGGAKAGFNRGHMGTHMQWAIYFFLPFSGSEQDSCKYSKNGCLRCGEENYAKWLSKKSSLRKRMQLKQQSRNAREVW